MFDLASAEHQPQNEARLLQSRGTSVSDRTQKKRVRAITTIFNAALTYAASIVGFLVLFGLWTWAVGGIDAAESFDLVGLYLVFGSILIGLWMAIPVFGVWIVMWFLLGPTGIGDRWRAVLTSMTAAGLGVGYGARTYAEFVAPLGEVERMGPWHLALAVVLAGVMAYIVWTVSPQVELEEEDA